MKNASASWAVTSTASEGDSPSPRRGHGPMGVHSSPRARAATAPGRGELQHTQKMGAISSFIPCTYLMPELRRP